MTLPSIIPYAQIQRLDVTSQMTVPAGTITNANITGSGSSAIEASKVQQQRTYVYAQDRNNWNAADWKITHIVYGSAGTINTLKAKLPVVCGAGHTVTVTWRLNGTSIGTVTFTDADAADTVKTATPSSTALVAGDDLSVQITVSGGTPGKGIAAYFHVSEYGS